MNLSADQLRVLMGPLNPTRVAHRNQSGRDLTYLEAFDVKATLIRLFGFGGFSAEVIDVRCMYQEQREREGKGPIWDVAVWATVRLTVGDAVYTEVAASMQSNPDYGEALDFAVKTAESDALKRAATYLGTQFGLSLYDQGSTREIVRHMFEPTQKALLEAIQQPPTDEQVAAIANTLGATVIAEEDTQPPEMADLDGHEARGKMIEDVPGPDTLPEPAVDVAP